MVAYNKTPFFFIGCVIIFLGFCVGPDHALNVGLHVYVGLKVNKECSRTCESKFCEVPPFLRYGKYCGLLYSGCPGERPCDRLDACCMSHDQCIQHKGDDYLSQQCNKEFLNCVERFRRSGAPSFKGNTCKASEVVDVIENVMNAAILAGKVFGKP
ncbi:phospholipase A2-alpha-like [Primulina tabacum]|uniref:phospholipase A2-alpha-like n=1 Tax=Primulina tabacum TaxID=48773 RepID=UPI003F5A9A68